MERLKFLIAIGGFIILFGCSLQHSGEIIIPEEPYDKLSDYNFFEGDLSNLMPADRVLSYDLNSPLFTDYALKARFVWMPEGTSAKYSLDHVLEFPKGTALIKNFYYNHDETDYSKGRRIMETRILISRGEKWDAYGYIWNEDQTDADYTLIGEIMDVTWINDNGNKMSINYIIPNKNQCKGCHAYDNIQMPIGPKVRNLNKNFAYPEGEMNQLKKWTEVGYLSGFKEEVEHPYVAVWDDNKSHGLHERAMAYLDINCGHCHQPKGAANTSGLTLLADSKTNSALGIYKATVSAGAGTGGHTYNIVPGHPQESILVYRMKSLNPGAMMPELGRSLVHDEGVSLIADWINAMDPGNFEKPQSASLN